MKKLFLSLMLLALPILASAYDAEVDGIYYNLNTEERTAEVTYQTYDYDYKSNYSGSVTIPEKFTYEGVDYSVTTIGWHAFSGCSSLTSVTIPNSVTGIRPYAFQNCSGLTSVTIPNSVTSIGYHAFQNCSGLTSVTIPNSVTTIGDYAFYGCSGLTSVTIPNSVTYIGSDAFENCSSLTSVTIPNSVTSIRPYAFQNCSGLTSVTIPNSVTTIEGAAFYGCSGLTSVTIPNSVTSIGGAAFYGCSGLTSVTIPNSVTSINSYSFYGCSSLTSVTIPNSVTEIREYAFKGCSSLTSVTIPNSVTTIGEYAFQNCSGLTSVSIGSSVASIGSYAFRACKNIETIYSKISKLFEIKENVFSSETYINAKLIIPQGMIYKYKNTTAWNKFLTIEESDFSGDDVSEGDMVELSLQDSERGEMSIALEKGKSYTLTITPANGWKVYMIIFNSKNVTDQLSGNKFTIPALTSNSYLNISYEQTSDVNSAKSIPVLISAKGGNISVKCEADGQEVNVYTIDGLSLGTATVKNGEALISTSIPSGDIAVVKVGGRSVKVIMR